VIVMNKSTLSVFFLLCLISILINIISSSHINANKNTYDISTVMSQYPTPISVIDSVYSVASEKYINIDLNASDYTLISVGDFYCSACLLAYNYCLEMYNSIRERDISVSLFSIWRTPTLEYGKNVLMRRGFQERAFLTLMPADPIETTDDLGPRFVILVSKEKQILLVGVPNPSTSQFATYITTVEEHARRRR